MKYLKYLIYINKRSYNRMIIIINAVYITKIHIFIVNIYIKYVYYKYFTTRQGGSLALHPMDYYLSNYCLNCY